ncbi:hypothetical protein ACIQU4_21005 [Streptomyces sp. NPDC090741]|uniref:hypothetical protein n=1 Tax=Streptomyces sp. NPDC090741 TaxID=3365967 RepID=UPI00382B4B2D
MVIENWQQAAVAVVVVLVLGLVLWSMRHRIKKLRVRLWGVAFEAAPEPDPGQHDVHTKRSKILKSLVSTVKGAKVGLVDTKVEDSWIVVRKDDDPEPGTGTGPGSGDGSGSGQPAG